MLPILALCSALATTHPEVTPAPAGDVLTSYEALAAGAGRGADAQVRLALWCDAHGLGAERVKHLARAVLSDPNHATARALLGLMSDAGKWRSPEDVAAKVKADEALARALAEYNARRGGMANSVDAHWKLALWCEQNGLPAEAKAHLTAVTRLDPGHEPAWKRLGCRRYDGRWMTAEQVAAEKAEAEAQRKADQAWRKTFEVWRRALAARGPHEETERALAAVSDPRAARAVWAVFARGGEDDQARAAQLFGQIGSPEASVDLAALTVFGATPKARRVAAETLIRRDPREFLGRLIGLIRTPIKFEFRPVGGPGRPGELFVEGERFNLRRVYEAPVPPALEPDARLNRASLTAAADPVALAVQEVERAAVEVNAWRNTTPDARALDPWGSGASLLNAPNSWAFRINRRTLIQWDEARYAALTSSEKLDRDVNALRAFNAGAQDLYERAVPVLKAVTGEDLGPDRAAWTGWWVKERGYAQKAAKASRGAPKPTFVENVPPDYTPSFLRVGGSCFAAGTPVRTLDGPRPIESVRVGDRVLSQDPRTGALSFQPVLAVFHNPPAPTLGIDLGAEPVVATGIHRFWKAGKGWVMARELKPGDVVRTLGGTARVVAVASGSERPVFNLEVAEGHSFFVGDRPALVHDHTIVQPLPQPFDAEPAPAASAE